MTTESPFQKATSPSVEWLLKQEEEKMKRSKITPEWIEPKPLREIELFKAESVEIQLAWDLIQEHNAKMATALFAPKIDSTSPGAFVGEMDRLNIARNAISAYNKIETKFFVSACKKLDAKTFAELVGCVASTKNSEILAQTMEFAESIGNDAHYLIYIQDSLKMFGLHKPMTVEKKREQISGVLSSLPWSDAFMATEPMHPEKSDFDEAELREIDSAKKSVSYVKPELADELFPFQKVKMTKEEHIKILRLAKEILFFMCTHTRKLYERAITMLSAAKFEKFIYKANIEEPLSPEDMKVLEETTNFIILVNLFLEGKPISGHPAKRGLYEREPYFFKSSVVDHDDTDFFIGDLATFKLPENTTPETVYQFYVAFLAGDKEACNQVKNALY